MLDNIAADQIQSEIQQIEELLREFAPLLERSRPEEPDPVERAAIGSVLHSFYTGVEGIFLAVAKRIDEAVPVGDRWHMQVLDQVASATERRGPVISASTRQSLAQYLAFRHFFRHAYAHVFQWDEMRDLAGHLPSVWAAVKSEIQAFVAE